MVGKYGSPYGWQITTLSGKEIDFKPKDESKLILTPRVSQIWSPLRIILYNTEQR